MINSHDWDEDDTVACTRCGHYPTRVRACTAIGCEDGDINLYEDDAINFDPGDTKECEECHGTGSIRWCGECGAEINGEHQVSGEHEWREHEWIHYELGNGFTVRVTPDVKQETLDALKAMADAVFEQWQSQHPPARR